LSTRRHGSVKTRKHGMPLLLSGAALVALAGCSAAPASDHSSPPPVASTASPVDERPGAVWYYRTGPEGRMIFGVSWGSADPQPVPGLGNIIGRVGPVDVAPNGQYVLAPTSARARVYDLAARVVATFASQDQFVWSADGHSLCRLKTTANGVELDVLEAPDFRESHAAFDVAISHRGALTLEACDPGTGRLLISEGGAAFPSTSDSFLIDVRSGHVVRHAAYKTGTVLFVPPDASLVAADCSTMTGDCTSDLIDVATGRSAFRVSGRQIRGISSDGQVVLTVGIAPGQTVAPPLLPVELRSVVTGSILWTATGHFQGAISGPNGAGFAVGLGPVGYTTDYDVLYVDDHGAVTVIAHHGALL